MKKALLVLASVVGVAALRARRRAAGSRDADVWHSAVSNTDAAPTDGLSTAPKAV